MAAVSAIPVMLAMPPVHENVHQWAKQDPRIRQQSQQAGQVSLVRDEDQSPGGNDREP